MSEPWDEAPVYTGWVQTLYGGDIERAQGYERSARRLLGALRTQYGINARLAAGEPGGFYKGVRTLEDGTRIEVTHNDGRDVIRIESPRSGRQESASTWEHWHADSAAPSHHHTSVQAGHQDHYRPPVTSETVPTRADEEDEEKKEGGTYLWVGVRVKYDQCTCPTYGLKAFMIEPDTGPTRGMLGNTWGSHGWFNSTDITFQGDTPVIDTRYGADPGITVDDLVQQFVYDYPQPLRPPGVHCLGAFDYTEYQPWDGVRSYEQSLYLFSQNGLRLYDSTAVFGTRDPSRWGPHDPLMDAAQNAGAGRSFAGRVSGFFDVLADFGWDAVFVLDPTEGEGTDPSDERAHVQAAQAFWQARGMAVGEDQVLSGDYHLVINAYGDDIPTSDRANATIPAAPDFQRSAHCDQVEHLVTHNYTPMQVEVEVRIGKDSDDDGMDVFTFDLTVDQYDGRMSTSVPYGDGDETWFEPCTGEGGPNPFGPNYGPVIAIDVENRSARRVERAEAKLAPIFGGGTWVEPNTETRSDLDIYIFGDIFPQVDDADYAAKAAAALYIILEACSSGSFGCSYLTYRSQASLEAALSGIAKGYVWRYSVMHHAVTALPIVSSTGDYNYDPVPDGFGGTIPSFYQEWLYWYYPYLWQTRAACRNSFALVIQSTPTYLYNGDQTVGPDRPAPNCC